MKFLDLTFPTPAENLAADEALLDLSEETGAPEILRVWEPTEYFVVVGYANKVNSEVDTAACRAKGIPIFRRCSGGGAVVQGPGCLNYSLVLNFAENPSLQTITQTNRFVMQRHRGLFESLLQRPVTIEGHTDLAMGHLKFSGNAQRRKKKFLLFHGTFLLDFDISLIEELLKMPSRQPAYRESRSHKNFLVNLGRPATEVKLALRQLWGASKSLGQLPDFSESITRKYRSHQWNKKF